MLYCEPPTPEVITSESNSVRKNTQVFRRKWLTVAKNFPRLPTSELPTYEKTTSYHKTASIPRQSSRHARPGLPPRPPVMFRVPRARRGDISGGRGGPLSSPRRVGISVARPRARLHRGEDPRTFRTKHEHDVDAHGSYRDDPRPGHGDRRRVRGSCRGRGARGSARACHFVGRRRRVPSDPPRKNDVTRRRVEKEREKV